MARPILYMAKSIQEKEVPITVRAIFEWDKFNFSMTWSHWHNSIVNENNNTISAVFKTEKLTNDFVKQ